MNKTLIFQKSPAFLKYIFAYLNGIRLNYWRRYRRSFYTKQLKEREEWSSAEYEQWQESELKKMLTYARYSVPYYKKYWDGLRDLDFQNLGNWPILEKQTIRDNPNDFLSAEYNKKDLYSMHTSGTSGQPMNFWLTRETIGMWYAMYDLRIKNWNGVTEKDSYGTFGGQLIVEQTTEKPPYWIWNQAMNQLYFSSYHIHHQSVKSYVEAMYKYKLTYLLGYVSSIYNIARIAKQEQLHTPKMKLVITNAEPLLKHQREVIEEVFDCRVIQTYSGCEYAFGGSEDLSGKMYLWPEAGIMEVEDENKELRRSGTGQFIITGLLNKAMPLIRYRVGDSGTICPVEEGSQSRNFEYLSEILGRTDDLVKSPEGRYVGRLDPVFKADFNISEAQIIQETLHDFTINIVPLEAYTISEGEEIAERLKERVSQNININLVIMDKIPRGSNGKFKAVISKLL